jgi:hypothetical protein
MVKVALLKYRAALLETTIKIPEPALTALCLVNSLKEQSGTTVLPILKA